MTKDRFLQTLVILALSASASAQSTSSEFTNLFAIGDSLAAGYSSASLVNAHQVNSVPALLAKQAGLTPALPLISEPGIPPELALLSLAGAGPIIAPKALTPGAPTNLGYALPYNDLAVPGSTAEDALLTVGDSNPFTGIILRGLGTQVAQVGAARPSFILVWVGNNDVLGAVVNGEAIPGVTITPPPIFRATYASIISTLSSTGAKIVAMNLPDVTTIPYATTIKPYVTNPATGQPVLVNGSPVGLIGPGGPLPPNDLVTLAAAPFLASGTGIPVAFGGNGQPLPDNVILDANKLAIIKDYLGQDNQAIADVCSAAKVPVFDVHSLLTDIATNGRDIGGIHLTSAFLTGGLFSYDGIHPTDLGYAVVTNEVINLINANGGSLPLLDLGAYLGLSAESARANHTSFVFTQEDQDHLKAVFPRVARR